MILRSLIFFLLVAAAPLIAQDTLSFGGVDLPTAEVRAEIRRVSPLAQPFTIEEVRRLPATFYDPARLIALLPGTVQTNDQATHLSVRGNTPNANLWRLNGLAVVNPNHTANAGTFYDLPTFNGGGVNALSAQVLDNSAFIAGGLPLEYGYANGGTFDLRLRPGNKERRQHQLQAGFIGFDAATEGPIGQNGRTSYLVNARYSFTGLLAAMGVDFGGEEISFWDLNAHLHHEWDGGEVSLFGVGGRSTNDFTPDPEEEITEQKQLLDIYYGNNLAIGGLNFSLGLGEGRLSGGLAVSGVETERSQSLVSSGLASAQHKLELSRTNANVKLTYPVGASSEVIAGTEFLLDRPLGSQAFYEGGTLETNQFYARDVSSFAPYIGYKMFIDRLIVDGGFRFSHYGVEDAIDEWIAEPRLNLSLETGGQRFVLTSEITSRAPIAPLLLSEADFVNEVPQTAQITFGYGRQIGGVNVLATVYAQRTQDEYAARSGDFLVSANNFLELDPNYIYTERTDTRRQGVELEAAGGQRSEGWYYRGSVTLFRAETQQADESWSKDRYSNDYATKLTLGREWTRPDKRERPRTLGLNLALIAHGGERYGEIRDVATPRSNQFFMPQVLNDGFVNSYGTYFRPDLRLYKTKVRPRTTTTLALDLQNVAGISNVGSAYYDTFLGQPREREGLGLIPVLSYRILWR